MPSASTSPGAAWSRSPGNRPAAATFSTCSVSATGSKTTPKPPSPPGAACPPPRRKPTVAALATGTLALENGKYALAESALDRASKAGKNIGMEARKLQGRLHWITGRHDEYVRFLRSQAEAERDPSETLRTLWSVDTVAYPIDAMRLAVGKANTGAPDDDRVWLALADVATRSGRFDEANDWLSRCEASQGR